MFAAAFNAAYAPWMAEIPRLKPPFGCQKNLETMGFQQVNLNWRFQDFWTIKQYDLILYLLQAPDGFKAIYIYF